MMSTRRRTGLAASLLLTAALLSACGAGTGTGEVTPGAASPSSSAVSPTTAVTGTPTSAPTAAQVALPTDCRAILSATVLAQLTEQPLNDPAFGAGGVQPDGSLVCIWGDPAADTTGLTTTIARMNRGPALDMLNALAKDEGFSCYQPDEGTRCEKTWQNDTYPVTDGRTLYWRQDVLIDTRYSNLAPTGYTSSIVASLFG